ncbi:MAG: hypothetical protein SGI87_05190 [Flavobacteriales bacterium]|nr:hypothetical protein [Flavobacteriales bacterium]
MKVSSLKLFMAAAIATFAVAESSAQLELGQDCGCPPLNARTTVNLSTLTSDANFNLPVGNTTLTCNNTYVIDEKIYVQDGADLFIQPGTVLRGAFGLTVDANALIVSRGGQLWANGTDCCPIIFTDANDPLDGSYSINIRGQWGGIIMLGRATNNLLLANGGAAVANGVGNIEGLVPGDSRNHYGGNDDNDNSGSLKYVSIRHGGTNIGANNEINGLTLGSIGRGTKLEYIEVISNDDDGIEFFGGTVDLKHAVVMFCNDDYFDWDQGYRGRGQFWYGVQLPGASPQGDEGFESDGDDSNSGNTPFSDAKVYNVTLIGRGANRAVEAREGTRGRISNSIFANFAAGVDAADEAARPVDTFDNWVAGTFVCTNNAYAGIANIFTVNAAPASAGNQATFAAAGNTAAPGIIDFTFAINIATNAVTGALNPVPANGTASSPEVAPIDDFFEGAAYKGAFKPGAEPWTSGWTLSNLIPMDNSLNLCPEDINGDGMVNVDDFLQLIGVFNTSCGL